MGKPEGKARASRDQLSSALSRVNLNAAGIDVGSSRHVAAVMQDPAEPPVRGFETFTAGLCRHRLAGRWGVETVIMESTGVYWIPLFGVLEERGFAVMLVDPRRIKKSGRTKDRRAGLPVAAATAHLRTALGSLLVGSGNQAPSELPAATGHADPARVPSYPSICRRL